MVLATRVRSLLSATAISLLAACGGGGGGFSAGTMVSTAGGYKIVANVTGLQSGTSLTLQLNGQNPLVVAANGGFPFPASLTSGTMYRATVATQPAGETCSVTNGSGTVGTGNVTNITVSCNARYAVGGVVSGLTAGKSVTLLDNNSDTLTVSTNGFFTFPTQLASGATYAVTAGTQPAQQTCDVTDGTGTATADVTSVTVGCTPNPTYAFVANANSQNVSVYAIDATTGALTQVPGSPFTTGSYPSSVTVAQP